MRSCKTQVNISQPDLGAIKSWLMARRGQVRFPSHHHRQGLPEAPSSEGRLCPCKELSLPLEGPAERGKVPLPHQDRRVAAEGSRRSPPTADSMSSVLPKAGTGTCRNSLQLGLLASRKEMEQQHPSKAASEGESGNAPHQGLSYTENRGGREQEVLEGLSGEY